jgi:microfibrillar-associated protein 1
VFWSLLFVVGIESILERLRGSFTMWVPSTLMKQPPTQSRAGAIQVRNERGEISMEKVKVKRYVSGKRPDYAPMESSDEEDGEFQFIKKAKEQGTGPEE